MLKLTGNKACTSPETDFFNRSEGFINRYISTTLDRMVITVYEVHLGVRRKHASLAVDLKDISVRDGGIHTISSMNIGTISGFSGAHANPDEHQPVRATLTFEAAFDVSAYSISSCLL